MESQLAIEHVRGRSVVTRARSEAPLRLLAPDGGGHAAWVFQSSLGGGFVGEDRVGLRVDVAAGASLFLGSQASTKVYRGARSALEIEATVGEAATLVAWPDPAVCFAGARFEQTQSFALAAGSRLVAVDAWTAGRIARGERWAFERLQMRLRVAIEGRRVLDDAILLDPTHGGLADRLGGYDAFATIVLVGLDAPALADALGAPLVTASAWPWGTVLRVAARSTEQLAGAVRSLVHDRVTSLLGADPLCRKW